MNPFFFPTSTPEKQDFFHLSSFPSGWDGSAELRFLCKFPHFPRYGDFFPQRGDFSIPASPEKFDRFLPNVYSNLVVLSYGELEEKALVRPEPFSFFPLRGKGRIPRNQVRFLFWVFSGQKEERFFFLSLCLETGCRREAGRKNFALCRSRGLEA